MPVKLAPGDTNYWLEIVVGKSRGKDGVAVLGEKRRLHAAWIRGSAVGKWPTFGDKLLVAAHSAEVVGCITTLVGAILIVLPTVGQGIYIWKRMGPSNPRRDDPEGGSV